MSTVERRRSPVYRQLEAYEQSWKKDHDAVRECWAWEDTVAVGLSTGSLIERSDHAWRDRVFRGAEAYSDEANAFHRSLFEVWLRVTDSVLRGAEHFEKTYPAVEGLPELRRARERIHKCIFDWRPPKLSAAVGLREMALPPEAAAELDRILKEPLNAPATPSGPGMREMSADELRERLGRKR